MYHDYDGKVPVRFGDFCGEFFYLNPGILEMATAIIAASTPAGVFLAADGLSYGDDQGVFTIVSKKQQKIFEITDERARFAFAITGTAAFTAEGDNKIIFNFNEVISRAADALKPFKFQDATNYCERLARTVNRMLKESVLAAKASGQKVTLPDNPDMDGQGGGMIALLFMCGFYLQTSCYIAVKFFHRGGKLENPKTVLRVNLHQFIASGSGVVSNSLYSGGNDAEFSQFRHHSVAHPLTLSFEQLAEVAKDYVAACESPQGLAADPIFCPRIAGHVHAASVTLNNGFRWITGFEPLQPESLSENLASL